MPKSRLKPGHLDGDLDGDKGKSCSFGGICHCFGVGWGPLYSLMGDILCLDRQGRLTMQRHSICGFRLRPPLTTFTLL